MSGTKKLPRSFYARDDVLEISKELIGKVLCTRFYGELTSGMIVETEAYNGRTDRASHAFDGTRTGRTETMYGEPGHAYVYLCYGIHHLFNVVTNKEGLADAILVRAIQPIEGIDVMKERRGASISGKNITNGPGKLSQALGITTNYDTADLLGQTIWIEDRDITIGKNEIDRSSRIGVDYAGEDAKLPWRFTLNRSEYLSK